jgi:hypothetical protein
LRVIGARAADQDPTAAVGVARGFPPAVLAGRPVGGLEVAPEATPGGRDGVEFLIGLSARKPGRYVARGVEVTYEQGGSRYRETMPDAVSVCVVAAPTSLTASDCAFPGNPPGEVG